MKSVPPCLQAPPAPTPLCFPVPRQPSRLHRAVGLVSLSRSWLLAPPVPSLPQWLRWLTDPRMLLKTAVRFAFPPAYPCAEAAVHYRGATRCSSAWSVKFWSYFFFPKALHLKKQEPPLNAAFMQGTLRAPVVEKSSTVSTMGCALSPRRSSLKGLYPQHKPGTPVSSWKHVEIQVKAGPGQHYLERVPEQPVSQQERLMCSHATQLAGSCQLWHSALCWENCTQEEKQGLGNYFWIFPLTREHWGTACTPCLSTSYTMVNNNSRTEQLESDRD